VSERITVVIADDHPAFRRGLAALLAADGSFDVVAQAGTGNEAVRLALDLEPDVVVMDLNMPDGHGVEATRQIVGARPHVKVAVLTMFEDDESVFTALRAGAGAYLLKDAGEDELVRAIEGVARGQAIFGAAVAKRVMEHFTAPARAAPPGVFPELTEREHELLDLLARGAGNQRIAARLGISDKTVRNHVSNILTKLQVQDRAQAVARARDAGLGGG
jgi:DNA-binding NarL/FixJ family response regulator